jgi:hypothetical protein
MLLIGLITSTSIHLARSFIGTVIVDHSVSVGSFLSAAFYRPIPLYSVSRPVEVNKQTFQLVEETTRDFLNGTTVGEWGSDDFEDAQEIMEVWSQRQFIRTYISLARTSSVLSEGIALALRWRGQTIKRRTLQ